SQTNTYYLTFDLSRTVFVRSPRVISYGRRKSDICDSESGIVTRPGRGLAAQRGGKSWRMTIIEDLPGQGPPVDSSHPTGPALVAAAADADPVTLLVLGWLAASRSENTRTAYARDIGISPPRRPSRAPSWLTWCQEQEVHPVTGATMLHVTRYARQLETAGLSPASAA